MTSLKELQFNIEKISVSIEKFAERFDIKHLSYEPIYKFTDIIIRNGKKLIAFNKVKYIKQKDKNFLDILEWSKSLLNKLKLN